MINEISYAWRVNISSICWTPMTRSASCNLVWNFGRKSSLMKLRKLSKILYSVHWVIWIWLRDFGGLKLASGCLQTATLTKSEQQQLDNVFWDAWFLALQKILKGKEVFLVSDTSTLFSETWVNYLSWKKRPYPWCFVQVLILAFVFNKHSPKTILLISIQSNSHSQIKKPPWSTPYFQVYVPQFLQGRIFWISENF